MKEEKRRKEESRQKKNRDGSFSFVLELGQHVTRSPPTQTIVAEAPEHRLLSLHLPITDVRAAILSEILQQLSTSMLMTTSLYSFYTSPRRVDL